MTTRLLALLATATALAGCSGGPGLTTGTIFGGSQASAAADAGPKNDPTSRAFQVGGVSARAVKCGYNFDPAKLKSTFLATEAAAVAPQDLGQIERTYDITYNAVAKAIAAEPNYCSAERTADIKAALTRHLAGDYTPSPPKKVVVEDSGWFDFGGSSSESGPSFGSDSWWEKQRDAVGN